MKQKELLAQLQVNGVDMNASGLSKLEGQIRYVTDVELIALADIGGAGVVIGQGTHLCAIDDQIDHVGTVRIDTIFQLVLVESSNVDGFGEICTNSQVGAAIVVTKGDVTGGIDYDCKYIIS